METSYGFRNVAAGEKQPLVDAVFHRVAGRYDLLIEVICETHDQLAMFLREHCYSRDDLASVEPMVGLAMYKNMLKWGQP